MNRNLPQTYENHRSFDYVYIVAILSLLPALLVALALLFNLIGGNASVLIIKGLLVYLLVISGVAFHKLRTYPLVMQDRIIVLEMRLRLQKLMPQHEHWQINGLTREQMIGLHYASDEELPDLAIKVLDQRINDREAIKRMIKQWTADYDRI